MKNSPCPASSCLVKKFTNAIFKNFARLEMPNGYFHVGDLPYDFFPINRHPKMVL